MVIIYILVQRIILREVKDFSMKMKKIWEGANAITVKAYEQFYQTN